MDEHSLTRILQQQLRFSSKIKSADAAVLIAITNEDNPKVLLTRRSVYLSNHAGEVSFPGGKRDPQDTSNIVVALREAYEETALNPFDVQLLGDLPMQKARNGMLVKPVVGLIPPEVELVAQPTEIDRIFFASLKQLMEVPAVPYEVRFAHQSLYFPSMRVENEIVWGMTAQKLVKLYQYALGYHKESTVIVKSPTFPFPK